MDIIDFYFASMLEKITAPMIFGWFLVTLISWIISKRFCEIHQYPQYRAIAITIMIAYLYFVLCVTLSGRVAENYYAYKLRPFWSWRLIIRGEKKLIAENIWNIVLFIPVGIITPALISKRVYVFFLPLLLSVSIEVTQLLTKRGLFEFDDIIHNTVGALLGILIFYIVKSILKKNHSNEIGKENE